MSVTRIITEIEHYQETKIVPGQTLLVFDEIQEVPDGIASLKYFCEDMLDLHVAVAGSLLGISLREGESYPVGKVTTMRMYPMTFTEFLMACGREQLVELLESLDWDGITALHEMLTDYLRQYFFVGGMPEAVSKYIASRAVEEVRAVQSEIIDAYERDIAKHTSTFAIRIHQVWQGIVPQLARENKKFIYGALRKGGRAADYEKAIQWLADTGLVYKVERVSEPTLPLKFYANGTAFKLFMTDCGLTACMAEANANAMLLGNNAFVEFKGAFTENYFLQQLRAVTDAPAYYYSKENSTLEIDFLYQGNERVVPVEVKAETNVRSKSLSQFVMHEFAASEMKALRVSLLPYKDQGWMENVPLYAVESFLRRQKKGL